MADIMLNEEELMLKNMVRQFTEKELAPRAAEIDEQEVFSWDIWKAVSKLGITGITLDPKHGGSGGTFKSIAVVIEELARLDASTSVTYLAHVSLSAQFINMFGSEEQKARWLPDMASGAKLGAFCLTEPGNGSDAAAINAAIKETDEKLKPKRVPLRFWHEGKSIVIEAGDAPPELANKEATIWFAVVQKVAKVPVQRGENMGKTLTYTNIVRELIPVGTWNGKAMNLQLARTAIMRPETEACIVLLQEGKAGPILGSAWTGLW